MIKKHEIKQIHNIEHKTIRFQNGNERSIHIKVERLISYFSPINANLQTPVFTIKNLFFKV